MLPIGWGIEGYIELNPDWNENLEAAMAAAAEDEDDVTTAEGGVGPGVAGEPKEVISVPLCPLEFWPPALALAPPLLPPLPPPLVDSLVTWDGVKAPPPTELPSETPLAEPPPADTPFPPAAALPDDPPELPLSLFWLRSFSSRRHLARRFENQTCFI